MAFSFFQRRTISPSKTKEKKKNNSSELSFLDKRENVNEINDLQTSIDNSESSKSISQLQEKVDNKTGIPDDLKHGVESLSGEDMSNVKVTYNSDKPSQLDANAYASGNDIHVAPGQEQHLPHEAWHVVQQKQNKVKPTKKADSGELINDDPALEKEADVMGEKALQTKSKDETNLNSNQNSNSIFQLKPFSKKGKKKSNDKGEAVDQTSATAAITQDPMTGDMESHVNPLEKENFADNTAKVDPLKETSPSTKAKIEEEMKGETRTYTTEEHLNEIFALSPSVVSTEIFTNYLKAVEISTEAHNNINNIVQKPVEKAENVKKLMTQLNALKGTKGKIYSRGEGEIIETNVTLGDFKDFNELYVDPVDYLPDEDIMKHAEYFKEGATKLDKVAPGEEAGVNFDFGRTQMGERGGSFFAPKDKQEGVINAAQANNGIYTIGTKLALGKNINPWLDKNYHKDGSNKGNPNDEIRVITIMGDLFSPELKRVFDAKIPKGNESGAYPMEWLPGGYAQSNENMAKEKELITKLRNKTTNNPDKRPRRKAKGQEDFKEDFKAQNLLVKLRTKRNKDLIKIASQVSKVPEIVISPISIKRFANLQNLDKLKDYKISLKIPSRKGDPENGKWSPIK